VTLVVIGECVVVVDNDDDDDDGGNGGGIMVDCKGLKLAAIAVA
jgi:hypothetical protein